MARWKVYSLDVWGNEEDGFEVNDRCNAGTIETSDDPPDAEVWCALIEAHIAHNAPISRAAFDASDNTFISIDDSETGRPVFQLERE